jgi:3-hydroxyacyl-CoA dehydrogenase/enoyl-CoA hydratase/3-hydroxybutyryl-CoA epimerase
VIEAVPERVELKREIFAAIDPVAPGALLATNTSSISLEDIASSLAQPSRLIGLHFFNPVPRMMLVEVVAGRDSDPAFVARGAAFVRAIDKLPLPVRSAPGFLVNRVLAPYLMAAMRCVDEGIAPEAIDEAAVAFGMPMGPIELADTVGLDICMAVGRLLGGEGEAPATLARHVAAGELGRKSGKGFYTWVGGRAQKGASGAIPPGLARKLVDPLVAEAQSALADGIVSDADLVDAGAIFGAGFAPFRGGPLHFAHSSAGAPAKPQAWGDRTTALV